LKVPTEYFWGSSEISRFVFLKVPTEYFWGSSEILVFVFSKVPTEYFYKKFRDSRICIFESSYRIFL
jgi:hypothetical protein